MYQWEDGGDGSAVYDMNLLVSRAPSLTLELLNSPLVEILPSPGIEIPDDNTESVEKGASNAVLTESLTLTKGPNNPSLLKESIERSSSSPPRFVLHDISNTPFSFQLTPSPMKTKGKQRIFSPQAPLRFSPDRVEETVSHKIETHNTVSIFPTKSSMNVINPIQAFSSLNENPRSPSFCSTDEASINEDELEGRHTAALFNKNLQDMSSFVMMDDGNKSAASTPLLWSTGSGNSQLPTKRRWKHRMTGFVRFFKFSSS